MYETLGMCLKSLLDWLSDVANDLIVLHAAHYVVLVGPETLEAEDTQGTDIQYSSC